MQAHFYGNAEVGPGHGGFPFEDRGLGDVELGYNIAVWRSERMAVR